MNELRQFFDQAGGRAAPELVREEFFLQRASVTAMALEIAHELRRAKGENLTMHPGSVCVLGTGILLVSADQVKRYHSDLYDLAPMVYRCRKGRRHKAYWVRPKESV